MILRRTEDELTAAPFHITAGAAAPSLVHHTEGSDSMKVTAEHQEQESDQVILSIQQQFPLNNKLQEQQGEQSPTVEEQQEEREEKQELNEEGDHHHHMNKSGFLGTSFNFINSILGVGIVGIPFALSEAGLVSGVILLIVMAFVTDWSVGLLIRTSQHCGAKSYPELCAKAFGVSGRVASAFFMWFLTFFGGIGYTIIVGDTMPAVLTAILGFPDPASMGFWTSLLVSRTFWILVTMIFIMLPLSLLDNISKLESFSFLSLIAEVILVGVVIAEAVLVYIRVSNGKAGPDDVKGWPTGPDLFIRKNIFGAIGVFSMAYITHHNSHMLYEVMKDATPKRFRRATHMSVFVSASIMLLVGAFGYLPFQSNTQGNILNNVSVKSIQGNIARAAIAITMFFTLPLEMFVCRNAAADILSATIFRNVHSLPVIAGRFQVKKIHLMRILVLIMLSVITVVAIVVKSLGSILELTGGFSAISLAYILPALCHLKLAEGKILSLGKIPALVLCIVGIVCFICGTTFNLYHIIKER